MSERFDDIMEGRGSGLINPSTRRGLFARAGAGAAAVGAARLFGGVDEAAASNNALCGVSGCWDQYSVEVCWRPYKTNKDTAVYYDPSTAHRIPLCCGRSTDGTLAKGAGVCLQSTRNPDCADAPPQRSATNGFVWGYKRSGSIAGWIPQGDLDVDSGATACCGPGGKDFPCGQPTASCAKSNPCNGGPQSGAGRSGRATVTATDASLRYAPQSTQFHWLRQGDVVDLKCYSSAGYYCCTVVSSQYANAPVGSTGWVSTGSF